MFSLFNEKAKDLFADTNVTLNFAHTGRIYGTFKNTFDMFYLKNNIKGQVISSMYISPGESDPFFSFYVLKKKDYPEEIMQEFEEKFLNLYLDFYNEMMTENETSVCHVMLVEYRDNKLFLHRFKEKWVLYKTQNKAEKSALFLL